MKFIETELKGAFIIVPELLKDDRGFFARAWCKKEFEQHKLPPDLVQCNISFNQRRGTLRGMHFQVAPHEESKLVRCTMGAIFDVIIDLRPNSPTLKRWVSFELTAENRKMLFIPEGFGNGFITLTDNTEVFYHMSEYYAPECARGVRWNDPAFDVDWPAEVKVISEKDMQYPDFTG